MRKALDPFHDFDVPVQGIPDSNTSKVVIQEVTKTLTISSSLGPTALWDLHVATMPELALEPMQYANTDQFGTTGTFGVPQPASSRVGPFVVVTAPAGGSTFPDAVPPSAGTQTIVPDFTSWFAGQKRLVAMAFEVHDTTADIYKQGTVTVYRMPQSNVTSEMAYTGDGGITFLPKTAFISRLPPANIGEAMLMSGSRQWEAKAGCYCVGSQDLTRADLVGSVWGGRLFIQGDNLGTNPSWVCQNWSPGAPQLSYVWKPTAFHTSGAYFTGLNANSTLTLTLKLIYETSPTFENTQLVVMAQPSPDYDPVAIEIYKQASVSLPPGVPVDQNASGDFWDSILSVIGDVAPLIGGMIPIPGAGVLGSLAGTAAKAVQASRKPSEKSGKSSESPQSDDYQTRLQKPVNFNGKPAGQKNSRPSKPKK